MERPPPTLTNNGITCATCKHLKITVQPDKSFGYQCIANPPTPVAAAQVDARGNVRWICNGFFAPIGDPNETWCGQHSAKISLVN